MLISKYIRNNYCFICMHAEESYHSLGFSERADKLGVRRSVLTFQTIKKMQDDSESDMSNIKYIVLDFNRIDTIDHNGVQNLIGFIEKMISQKINVIFNNVNERLFQEYFKDNPFYKGSNPRKKLSEIIFWLIDHTFDYLDLKKQLNEEHKKMLDEIRDKAVELMLSDNQEERLSSRIKLEKYFDFKKLMSKYEYVLYLLYLMAVELTDNSNIYSNPDYVLFCQTINGAFVATILSELLSIDFIYLDHIGPINSTYRGSFETRLKPEKKYFIVSDVICMGTEVRIAEGIIRFIGGKYGGNISFLRVNLLPKPLENEYAFIEIKSDSKWNYTVKTEFCKKCNLNECKDILQ